MMCLYCAQNRAVKVSDWFYSARCVRGYPHQDEGCAGFLERSKRDEAVETIHENEQDSDVAHNIIPII